MSENKVVVTGMGVVSPVGNNLEELWNNLINGVSGVDYIKNFDASNFSVKIAGEVKDFDESKYLDKKEQKKLDRFLKFAIYAAMEALQDANLNLEDGSVDPTRVAVIIGSGMGGLKTIEDNHRLLVEVGYHKISPFFVPYSIIDMTSGIVSIKTKAKGANYSIVSACASGANAIGTAYLLLKTGKADVVITGGTEAAVTPLGLGGFIAARALTENNDPPQKASRPFDKNRSGFVMGEGAGILILETEEHAKKRGVRIYAELAGVGMTGDAYHITAPAPEGEGAARAIKEAIKDLPKEKIGYINAHGTSTKLNDKNETAAIKAALGEELARSINISSTKSMTGHLLGAAGAVEAIVTVLTLVNGKIHPTINYEEPDPECDLNYTPNEAVERDVEIALSNSLGFGGHNVTLAFRKVK